jgi:hypothetical protein
MYSQVHLHLTHSEPALLLPSTALVVRPSGTQVITVDASQPGQVATLRYIPVTIGRDFGGEIEVQSGVTNGMTVVANPSADLDDGMRVKIATPTVAAAKPNAGAPASSAAGAVPTEKKK